MNKRRVLFFLPLPPPVHGAALRNKSLVESKLIKESFLVNVLPFNFAKESGDIGKLSFEKLYQGLARTFQIIYRIVSFRPNLVYFNVSLYGFALYRDYFYTLIFKLFRCHILFHLRTQGVKDQVRKSDRKKKLFRSLFRKTAVICLSEFLSKDIEDVYDGKPMIINNGIEDVNNRMQEPKPMNPVPVILFLANLARAKGVLELLDALKILRDRQVPFSARFVGAPIDVSLAELQERISSMSLTQNASVLGPIFGEDKFDLLRSADIYVLPTYFEAFPGTVLEAMQFALPVVSTFEGAIPEIVDNGKTGFLIERHDTTGLAEKLQALLRDKGLRESFGAAGRQKFEKNYTLEMFEKKMKTAFDEAMRVGD